MVYKREGGGPQRERQMGGEEEGKRRSWDGLGEDFGGKRNGRRSSGKNFGREKLENKKCKRMKKHRNIHFLIVSSYSILSYLFFPMLFRF